MKSYLKFLSRNKLYTAIEAIGLAVSLAFVILIGTYVWQQYKIAYEHPDYKQVYAITTQDGQSWTGYLDKDDIDAAFPEVEVSCRYSGYGMDKTDVSIDGEHYLVTTAYIDKEFFELFPYYTMLEGSADVLEDPSKVIVSRRFANKIAGEGKSVIGTRLRYKFNDADNLYTIAGVMEDFGQTLFSYADIFFNSKVTGHEQFGYNTIGNFATLFRVAEGCDREVLLEKLKTMFQKNYRDWVKPELRRIDEVYFNNNGYMMNTASKSMLHLLIVVVLALLVSAVFNYINLSFALTGKRAKEMATRRLVGANKSEVFLKCLMESVAFTLVCFAVALLLAIALVPMMNGLLASQEEEGFRVPLSIDISAGYILVCVVAAVILGIVAGIMPAWVSSRFKPIDVIKGRFRRQDKKLFSKVFIVIQNILSVVLIAMCILMEVQLSHMANRPMNANMENLYFMYIGRTTQGRAIIDRMSRLPEVKSVGVGSGYPGEMNMEFGIRMEEGKPHISVSTVLCDSVYFRLIALKLVEDFHYPLLESVWLGESAAAALNLNDSTSAMVAWKFNGLNMSVVNHVGGIFKDIPTKPATDINMNKNTAFIIQKPENIVYNFSLLIETFSESKEIKDKIMAEYTAFAQEIGNYEPPYVCTFLSDSVKSSLAPTKRTIRLVEVFMLLSVLLSLLGLVAMSTYFSEQKSKDIAIRKVFGGTIESETIASVRIYMILVLIACFIGVPIAIYAAGRYLEQFSYRIENYWWIFALAVLISFVISLLSVIFQTVRAAKTNPATELKKE